MTKQTKNLYSAIWLACLLCVSAGGSASVAGATEQCPAGIAAWCKKVGDVTPVLIELQGAPGVMRTVAAREADKKLSFEEITANAKTMMAEQDKFLASLKKRGVRARLRAHDAVQPDGSVRHVQYRMTYTLNGLVAYVATADLNQLRKLPEVASVEGFTPVQYAVDHAVDFTLGTDAAIADRRLKVYGAIEELEPTGSPGHPETPDTVTDDGLEGQNMIIAIIDSGVDWRHPMFGGTGQTTPPPRFSAVAPDPANDHQKIIYYFSIADVADPTDDFGHGTLVASTAAGYRVDGNTPANLGFGLGQDGTGIGPTPNGRVFQGAAPQAQIMGYKVCNPAGTCTGDIALAIEDAVSPFTLISAGTQDPQMLPKPVADVINLSLGSTSGDNTNANSRQSNNATLAGTIVVTSAGNSGPGPGTVGAPGSATLAVTVGASTDPGSVAGVDLLLPGEVPADTGAPAGPQPETGNASAANLPDTVQGLTAFPVAGGGFIPEGSLSAHYVYYDQVTIGLPPPTNMENRICMANGTGAFANIANQCAALLPSAIFIITATENATALVVATDVPTYTISEAKVNQLGLTLNSANHDVISAKPIRLSESVDLPIFNATMAGFSSRGPNDHGNADFRVIKPDVTGPGVAVAGAATPEGTPDQAIGLASETGYTQASGTSFSSPITAGGMVLIRQHLRENLGLDSTDPADHAIRYNVTVLARAMLMNAATNMRTGTGVVNVDPDPAASVNDMGAGYINIAGALEAKAALVAPTLLFDAGPNEYDGPPYSGGPTGTIEVEIASVSYALVPVRNAPGVVARTHEVRLRDFTGTGGGTYNLSFQDNRLFTRPGFSAVFTGSEDSQVPITSISLPTGGEVSFWVRTEGDGAQLTALNEEIMWYATAVHASSGQRLRMPFYYRVGNGTDIDFDNDGIPDAIDNCFATANNNQADDDADGVGNACDNCPTTPNGDQADSDGNGMGDACELADIDMDGIEDSIDNCPLTPNNDQVDVDADTVGDVCDNCLLEPNADQCNTNGNGTGPGQDNFGNVCDADLDNNGIVNSFDLSIMRDNFGASGANDSDLDCNGIVNSFDLTIMRDNFGGSPGPSGL